MGTNCTTFLADLFLDTLEVYIKKRNKDKNKYRS
jgi:hypothetical protein